MKKNKSLQVIVFIWNLYFDNSKPPRFTHSLFYYSLMGRFFDTFIESIERFGFKDEDKEFMKFYVTEVFLSDNSERAHVVINKASEKINVALFLKTGKRGPGISARSSLNSICIYK